MKDFIRISFLIGIVVMCFILQIYVLNNISFFGVRANILLTLCVVLSVWAKPSEAIPFCFLIGIISDLLFTFSIGKYLVTYIVISFLIIAFSTFYNRQNKGTTAIIVGVATIIAEYIFGIYNVFKFMSVENILSVTFVGFKGAIINIIIGIVLTKIIKKAINNKRNNIN